VLLSGLVGGLLTSLALAAPARADEARAPRPYAVLIGISNYPDKQIKPRPHAEADVKAIYDLLTNKDYLGIDPQNVRLLTGEEDAKRGSEKATHENILKALKWVAKEAHANDPVYLVFIGEGGPLGETGDRRCYFAVDSTFKDRGKDAVAAADVGEALKNLKSQKFAGFIDVDFKGYVGAPGGNSDQPLGKDPYKEFIGDDGSEDHSAHPGRVLFLATNGLSTSLDLKEHGLFAQLLLDALKGKADKDGYEPDGVVTVDEVIEYLDKKLPELARETGKNEKEKGQTHFVLGGRGNHFVLTTNPAVSAKVKERLEKLAKLADEGKVSANLAEEGKGLLSQMPRLEAQRNLRKEYQRLVDGSIDVEMFKAGRTEILASTKLRRPDAMAFATKVIEATNVIREGYVKDVSQGDMVAWAVKGIYRRIDEKIPAEIENRLKKVKTLKESELKRLLADVRERLGKREDLDNHKDLDVTLQRMLANLDPYTTYIDPETKAKFDQDINSTFTGIGIQIRKDPVSDMLKVVTPIKGSPAYKIGLKAGDLITKIIREVDSRGNKLDPVEEIPTKGLALSDAVKKILGQPDTKVKLTVQRDGVSEPMTFEITRGRVEVETVLGHKRKTDDDWDFLVDPENRIGYIRLTQFSRNSYRDLKRVMDDLVRQGIKGFILDLRFNPGGLLDSAVKISDLYIDDGLIVSIRPRVGRQAKFNGTHEGSLLDFPMVCMVNGFSASGSEIVSAALQDHKRAMIVGERSYGKGSVQNIQPFEGGDIKLTTASFWRPSGRNLNKSSTAGKDEDEWGVTPDQEIKLSRKERDDLAEAQHDSEIIRRKDAPKSTEPKKEEFKDKQLDAALEYLRGQIKTASRLPIKKAG
jgi:C-terminal peptidase prc